MKDGAGKILATTTLPAGKDAGNDCIFTMKIEVPDSKFYGIEVSHRGTLNYSRDKLAKQHWLATLSIGD